MLTLLVKSYSSTTRSENPDLGQSSIRFPMQVIQMLQSFTFLKDRAQAKLTAT